MREAMQNRVGIGCYSRFPGLVLLVCAVLAGATACSSTRSTEPSAAGSTLSAAEMQRKLVARGRSQFLHCNSCHAIDAQAPQPFGDSVGPHLEHIVGRSSASVQGFAYTGELRALDLVWDEQTLDEWLRNPQDPIPGMCGPFMGIANPGYRKALIAYLKNPPR